ncbi:hypothetical protein pb186bvf_011758 [Paramecium bursaria]
MKLCSKKIKFNHFLSLSIAIVEQKNICLYLKYNNISLFTAIFQKKSAFLKLEQMAECTGKNAGYMKKITTQPARWIIIISE